MLYFSSNVCALTACDYLFLQVTEVNTARMSRQGRAQKDPYVPFSPSFSPFCFEMGLRVATFVPHELAAVGIAQAFCCL